MMKTILTLAILCCATAMDAALSVKIGKPKTTGSKTVITLTMTNTFAEKIESARATVFLSDDQGKVIATATQWVIGGTKDRPALAPDAKTTFNFVVTTERPFSKTKVTFNRLVLEGGKLASPRDVQISE